MSTVTTSFLADDAVALPVLQSWFQSEWRSWYGPAGPGNAAADLRATMNRTVLPIALVARLDGELCGTAALKGESVATHRHLGPWLAGLLVGPRFRRHGVGGVLINEIEMLAARMGFRRLYCATSTMRSLLERRGWHRLAGGPGDGEYTIYVKSLGSGRG